MRSDESLPVRSPRRVITISTGGECGAQQTISYRNINRLFLHRSAIVACACGNMSKDTRDGHPFAFFRVSDLADLGFGPPDSMQPTELFGLEAMSSFKGFLILALGGLLVGFGSRYAGGCTSGHAISGISDLQIPSLIAVVGFFIGGLTVTWLLLPYILAL